MHHKVEVFSSYSIILHIIVVSALHMTIGLVTRNTPVFAFGIWFLVPNLTVVSIIVPVKLATGISDFVLVPVVSPRH